MKAVNIMLVCFWASVCVAAADPPDYSGYAKVFLSATDEAGDAVVDNVERLRLRMAWDVADDVQFKADYEARWRWSERTESERTMDQMPTRARFMDLETEHMPGDHVSLAHGLDRLRIRYEPDPCVQWTIGRQAVSWGTGRIWSPVDVFAAFAPTEIDKEEKLGVDVVRVFMSSPSGASLDLVAEPLDVDERWTMDPDDSSLAMRIGMHHGEFDLHGYAGVIQSDWIAGADLAGYAGEAGIHGELMHTWVEEGHERDYLRTVVGMDYGFAVAWSPTVAIEYFFNGLGEANPEDYVARMQDASVVRVFARGIAYNIGREYVGGTVSVQPVGLVIISATTLANLHDASFRQLAAIEWSVAENVDVMAGVDVGYGETPGEFTMPPDVFYVYGKYYF